MPKKIKHNIKLYCEYCGKETEHKPIRKLVKDFMDGAFMMMTKGWSLMNTTQMFKCCECGNEIEVEVEE